MGWLSLTVIHGSLLLIYALTKYKYDFYLKNIFFYVQGDKNGNTALHYCVICDDADLTAEICRYMLRYQLDINQCNKFGHSASSLAFFLGKKETLQALINEVGKDVLQFKVRLSVREK